ncbi:MAG: hypothetical protein BECKG1743D_GA0114223_104224 [Candidatus Kentron sp. G]|nr:MAG: hypothetical protein BECKG1743F_GA0114225_100074 [Candidatus Kentron sp. G]VFM95619.1 MAG: hypothetical protein BECKG1743E_GA0114224_100094 [Candidatus Kentron sp. G]VFN03022.1 MAG: hypothetical protein BECKG1743D_GA0114223_104224 [Candidatus Kentron sp. G]
MNKLTREEEEIFVEQEKDWVEGDNPKIDQGAVTTDKEESEAEENRFVEQEEDWVEGDKRAIDQGAVSIDRESATVEENRFVEQEEDWVEGDKRAVDQGAVSIDKETAVVEEKRFFEEEKDWVEGDDPKMPDLGERISQQIEKIRKELPEASKTAKAIDQKAPWTEISQIAEQEGVHEIANLIFEAEQQGLDD